MRVGLDGAGGGGRPMSRGRPLEIAIVGMGCRFPGAEDLCAYWENILAGKDCTRDVPADRWDPATFVDPSSTANDRVPCGRGGYLDSPIAFRRRRARDHAADRRRRRARAVPGARRRHGRAR